MKLSDIKHELLTEEVTKKLLNNHVVFAHDFMAHNVALLCQKSGLNIQEIFSVREAIKNELAPKVLKIADCPSDQFVEDIFVGLNPNYIYELYGPPGSGKTQIAMHLASKMADMGKNVLYVDTKNDFSKARLSSLTNHLCHVKLAKVFDLDEALKIMSSLANIREPLGVKLLVLDNIASLIWPLLEDNNIGHALGLVAVLVKNLRKIAHYQNLTVFVINNSANNRPALGKIFAGVANTRFLIKDRRIKVEKSLDRPYNEEISIEISESSVAKIKH